MFLSRIIFRVLRIIQIQGIDFTYQESFNTCFISLLGYRIGFFGYVQLLCLIIEMLHQQKDILVEVDPDYSWLPGLSHGVFPNRESES